MKPNVHLSAIRAQNICCPNCGSRSAERHWSDHEQTTRTECPDCDYLLISCSLTANVVEAYFPSSIGPSRGRRANQAVRRPQIA